MQVLTEFDQLVLKLRDLCAVVNEQVPREKQNTYFQTVLAEARALVDKHSGVRVASPPHSLNDHKWTCADPLCTAIHVIADLATGMAPESVALILVCPGCGERHVDKGRFAEKPHKVHACQHCGLPWQPALHETVGVRFLPGFKDEP